MKINIILLALICIIAGTYTYWMSHSDKPVFTPINDQIKTTAEDYAIAPNFTYTALSSDESTLYALKGQKVIIHFWATWCAPCLVELPEIISYAAAHPDIKILAISSDENIDAITRFVGTKITKDLPNNFVIIHDPRKDITLDLFQTTKLPESFILDKNMAITRKIIGAFDAWNSESLF